MDTSLCRSHTFMALVIVTLLLSSTNGQYEGPCDNVPSQTWKGICSNDAQCNAQCMQKEGAASGKCNLSVCNCTFNCKNTCQKPSGLWRGLCLNTGGCNQQCRQKENSVGGSCINGKCICFYTCH